MRKKYFKNLADPVKDYILQQRDIFRSNMQTLLKIEKPNFDQIFENVMDMREEGSQSDILYVKKMKDLFKMYLWDAFSQPSIDKFCDKLVDQLLKIEEIGTNFLVQLVVKFLQINLKKYVEMVSQQAILLCEDYTPQQIELQEIIDSLLDPNQLKLDKHQPVAK